MTRSAALLADAEGAWTEGVLPTLLTALGALAALSAVLAVCLRGSSNPKPAAKGVRYSSSSSRAEV